MIETARIAGSRGPGDGTARVLVRIAGITVALVSDEPELTLGLDATLEDFLVEGIEPDVTLLTRWGDLGREVAGDELFDSGGVWRLSRDGAAYVVRFSASQLGPIPYKIARFNPEFTTGQLIVHRPYFRTDQPVNPLEYPLDELLMVNLLGRGRGVEIHACGATDGNGNGHLFVGHSGAGKTTMAGLWQREVGGQILSDDRIVLREADGRLWMHGTPWHGEAKLASPMRAPLSGIFFLRQARANALVSLGRAEAAARLFACSFPPFYSREALGFTLGFLDEVVTAVPCHELSFLPEERAVQLVGRAA